MAKASEPMKIQASFSNLDSFRLPARVRASLVFATAFCALGQAPRLAAQSPVVVQDGYSFSGTVNATPLGDFLTTSADTAFPAGTDLGMFAFRSGVYDGSYVWFVPVDADQIVRFDPADGSMTGFALPSLGVTNQKFTGGVFDGTYIWLVPFDADAVVRVAVADGSTATFDAWPAGFTKGSNAFAGGVFDGTYVWFLPYSADRVIRLDPSDGSMTGYNAWPTGFIKGDQAFWGGIFDGTDIWLVPYSADRVVKLETGSGTMTGYDAWPAGFTKGDRAFAAGTFDGSSIWLTPYDADRVVSVDTDTGTMTGYAGWPSGFNKGTEAFAGAIYDGDDVWMVPFDADRIVKVDAATGAMRAYPDLTSEVTATNGDKFAGAAFDGSRIFLVPAEEHVVVSLSTGTFSRLVNLSCRAQVGAGDDILIPGFVISGTESKTLLIRGVGPGLSAFGVSGVLETPTLSLYSDSTVLASNTGWSTSLQAAEIESTAATLGAFPLSSGSADCALLETLSPGRYTVHLQGVGGGTGVGLVEIYDASDVTSGARLVNVSARAQVGTGADVLIPGYVIGGNGPRKLLIRAVGPGLSAFGVTGVLEDPKLTVYSGSDPVETNDDWELVSNLSDLQTTTTQVGAFSLESGSKDAAVLVTLNPGPYTVQVSGVGGTSGVALVELFEVP